MKKTTLKFFIYIRKSTDDRKGKRQVLSLDAQLRELRDIVKSENLAVVGIIEESQTAKEPGRPLFNRMLKRIEAGEANGIIIWDIDRLYRNPADEGTVRWLLQRGVIACVQTPTRAYFPEDAGLLIAIEGGRASDFIIHHKRNVARGVREKLLRGEWPGQRPVGFVYDHDLRNIAPDPQRWKIILTIFEEYAGGRHGLMSASARLFDLGVKSRSGRPWSKYAVWHLLTNRLYIGVMGWKGETYEGRYKTLIPPDLFDRVQKTLKVKSKPRRVRNGHNFPFCGLFRCTCGSMMSAQWAKGNGGLYRYYRCTRKAGGCSEPYTQERSVAEQCLARLRPIAISSEQADALRALVEDRAKGDGLLLEAEGDGLDERIELAQGKLNRLTRGYLDEVIDEDSYRSAKEELIVEKAALKREKERLRRTRSNYWIEPAREVINTLELAGKSQAANSPQEIALVVHKVGTNRLLSRKTVTFSFSEDYDFIPSLLASRHASTPTTMPSLGDGKSESTIWCA